MAIKENADNNDISNGDVVEVEFIIFSLYIRRGKAESKTDLQGFKGLWVEVVGKGNTQVYCSLDSVIFFAVYTLPTSS